MNGFSHFPNGHKVDSTPPALVAGCSRYPTNSNVATRTYCGGPATTASLTQSVARTPATMHLPYAAHPSVVPRPPNAPHPPNPAVPHPANTTRNPNPLHPTSSTRPPNPLHPGNVLHQVNANHPLPVRAVAAPAPYMSYPPAVPPPASRGYYAQPYPSTSHRKLWSINSNS